jgi:Uncharacterized conserved protein
MNDPRPGIHTPDTVSTEDGTITCRDPLTGEHYHNRGGAYKEAVEGYALPARLDRLVERNQTTVRVLDICFGMGYNAFTLVNEILKNGEPFTKIEVEAIEMDLGILQHFPAVIGQESFSEIRAAGLTEEWARDLVSSNNELLESSCSLKRDGKEPLSLTIRLHRADLRKVVPRLAKLADSGGHRVDFIFHDPFSPNKVPELWTLDLFACYRRLIADDGRVLTYSAATAIRAGLIEAGFDVYRTKGVAGKKGGTLAVPATGSGAQVLDDLIFTLDDDEASRLQGRTGVPYRDQTFNGSRNDVLHRRFKEQDDVAGKS